MRILIDYRPALRRATGVGIHIHHLAQELAQLCADQGDELVVFTASWSDRIRPDQVRDLAPAVIADTRWPVRFLNYVWPRWGRPHIERIVGLPIDITHSPTPLTIPSRSARRAVTVHDLWFLNPDAGTWGEVRRDYQRFLDRSLAAADVIFTVSQTVRDQLLAERPTLTPKVVVVPNAVPGDIAAHTCESDAAVLDRLGLSPSYVLFTGTLSPRKNPRLLLEAMLRPPLANLRPPLVIAGDGPLRRDLEAMAVTADLPVTFLGYVERADMGALLCQAACLVMPSLDEGFGIPALEAMAVGTPLIASRRGALPEIIGSAGLLLDTLDPVCLAEAIAAVLSNHSLATKWAARGREQVRRFSWTESAARVYAAYRAVVSAAENR